MVNEIIYTLGPCCCSYHYTVYRHNIVGLKLILLLNLIFQPFQSWVEGSFALVSIGRMRNEKREGVQIMGIREATDCHPLTYDHLKKYGDTLFFPISTED